MIIWRISPKRQRGLPKRAGWCGGGGSAGQRVKNTGFKGGLRSNVITGFTLNLYEFIIQPKIRQVKVEIFQMPKSRVRRRKPVNGEVSNNGIFE